MKNIFTACICISACGLLPAGEPAPPLIWPIDRPKKLTGSFAEFRGARYHHGIDISCDKKKGFAVYAAASGRVESVIYKNSGIGYGLVLVHRGGYKTLYGHMDRFSEKILHDPLVLPYADRIRAHKDFRIDVKGGGISLSRGDIIGYSGDTGIGAEHLHFELMDAEENPLNPLRAGLIVPDDSSPVIRDITLVPLDEYSHCNGRNEPFTIPVVKTQGRYIPDMKKTPRIG
ncbi:MAG: M23 family metallopeptidase, partial [Spirochaetota bacterium]